MAEVLGVIASVIAIASLAKPTAKLVKALKDITKNDVSITKDVIDVATHIELTSETIALALLRLENHCKKIKAMENPQSRVARYIKSRNLERTMHRTSNDVKRHLRNAERHLSSMLGRSSLMNSLKWYMWNNKEVSAILTKMDRVALCLNIIGHNMELELTTFLYEEAKGEVAKCMQIEIDSLRSQLEVNEKSLQRALESRGRETKIGSDLSSEFRDFGTLLLNLSERKFFGNTETDIQQQRFSQLSASFFTTIPPDTPNSAEPARARRSQAY
ncbi:hypothetical protein F53441_56 [Fusarium austroafricanum]|uniref:Fungal N-terminal domain-containing protein n=1 Tax=Fusarium austroafricanum TaxID=2364996 RepID=A0A8H4KWN9_9HYPO|nr:hypothetical protein F53441_56 [Fusarium austroafricanum]